MKRIVRLPEVETKTGYKHSTIYRRISEGTFPAPIRLGPKAVGWLQEELDSWIADRVAERDQPREVA